MMTPLSIAMVQQAFSGDLGISLALAAVGVVVLVLASLLALFVTRYKRCPANKVMVISGRVGGGKNARTLSGGAAFVWPIFQQYDYLSLLPLTVERGLDRTRIVLR